MSKRVHPEVIIKCIRMLSVHLPQTSVYAHHANIRANLTRLPFLLELRVRVLVRALPASYPRAILGATQADETFDIVAVNSLCFLCQLTSVQRKSRARKTLLLTFLRGLAVVGHGVQVGVGEGLPVGVPRRDSEKSAASPLFPKICSPNCCATVSGNIFRDKLR